MSIGDRRSTTGGESARFGLWYKSMTSGDVSILAREEACLSGAVDAIVDFGDANSHCRILAP